MAFAAWTAPARSQGLADQVGLGLTPPSSVATVDDASAVMVNPAGIGFTVGPELLYVHSSTFGRSRSDVDSLFAAVTVLDLLGMGAGVEVARPALSTSPTLGNPFVRGSLSYALRIDDRFSIGGSYRVLGAQVARLATAQMWDAGFTVRPFRFLSSAVVVENLLPPETGRGPLVPRAYRVGFGLRPDAEWATLGLEARIDEQLRVDPALLLRIEPIDGFIASLQLAARDVGRGFHDSSIGLGLEVNYTLFGAGASAASSLQPDLAGLTAYARITGAAYPTSLPRLSRVVRIVAAGDLRPVPPDDPLEAATYSADEIPGEIPLALERAARDSSVEAVLIEIRPIEVGLAQVQSLRRRLEALRSAGKRVFALVDRAGDREYLLAAAADSIIMPPSGSFAVDGVGSTMEYFAAALEHIGVRAHAIAAGDYKSAPEVFTQREPSPAALEMEQRINDVLAAAIEETIARDRNIDVERVRALIDRGLVSPEEARENGLVDYVAYGDEIEQIIEKELGSSPFLDDDYLRPLVHRVHWGGIPTIAVVPIVDTITTGKSSRGFLGLGASTGSEDIVKALESAVEDDDVKAVVLRIDSPGGDALASDLIWRAVAQVRQKKPVVASFGDVAASGGYYAACGADAIFAEPTTITGSIGVFALFFSAGELLDRLGVDVHEESRGERANTGTFHREPTAAELASVRGSIAETYLLFKNRVAAGRRLDLDRVEEVSRGRVWIGSDALDRKLVDQIGGLAEAVADARRRAGIDDGADVDVTVLRNGEDPIARWRSAIEGARVALGIGPELAPEQIGRLLQPLGAAAQWVALAAPMRPLALLPYRVDLR
ncbi:MAG: signal peptide peptidase SppA [Deltaproteobacteria bacterium]|nr:signal peptide peptidase SppA [Deltaproteobacteria bacterium]